MRGHSHSVLPEMDSTHREETLAEWPFAFLIDRQSALANGLESGALKKDRVERHHLRPLVACQLGTTQVMAQNGGTTNAIVDK